MKYLHLAYCDHCGSELLRSLNSLTRSTRLYCGTPCQNANDKKRGVIKTTKAHDSIRKNGHPKHRGRPAAWVDSSKREEICRKISEIKKHSNWMKGRTGERSPSWAGGKLWWKGSDWDSIKYMVRVRDDFRCVKCGITEEEHIELIGAPLQVDHIIPYRISQDNEQSNLQTLCNSCHGKKTGFDVWLMQNTPGVLQPVTDNV